MSGPLLKDVQALPIGSAPLGCTTPLAAFWVGDMDIYAAHSAEHALALCNEHSGMPDSYELDDVDPVSAETLAMPMVEEDGEPAGTLAELLAEATEPGYLVGFE